MRTRVQKWGNSLALRIPKTFASDANLQKDSSVELSLVDGRIIIQPVTVPALSLEQLLSGVTRENMHHEIDTGLAQGNEVW